jgi:serine/threonine protein kinase
MHFLLWNVPRALSVQFSSIAGGLSLVASSRVLGPRALHLGLLLEWDLKPDDVLLDNEFNPRITDLGIAKLITLQSALEMT